PPFSLLFRPQPLSTLFPYTTLFRSLHRADDRGLGRGLRQQRLPRGAYDRGGRRGGPPDHARRVLRAGPRLGPRNRVVRVRGGRRSEEHTSELQSRENLVCRLLLEKK